MNIHTQSESNLRNRGGGTKYASSSTFLPEIRSRSNKNGDHFRKQPPTPNSHIYAVIALMFTVFIAVIVLEKKLPAGLKLQNANMPEYKDRFISERSFNALKNLTSIGPRVAGSFENEILAVNFLKGELEKIKEDASYLHDMEIDFQKSSGAFKLTFLDGMTNVYNDVQNVVVKINSKLKSNHSILLNCHYDTVMDSPGASDDGAGCAVMLEILRVIATSNQLLKHSIIFLFNGAEENIMQGSHGFITQHRWAKSIRAFINIEACGAGGRELLFQAGPNNPWILETYSQEVPYPYASSLAQEIFQSGIIPGETDFRIFRDFGKVSGVDFAWSTNGYVYHTKFDTVDQIPLGTLQRTGDNILALVRGIAAGHQISDVESYREGNLVFFDMLGAFVIRWRESFVVTIDLIVIILSAYSIYRNSKWAKRNGIPSKVYIRELFRSTGFQIVAWFVSLIGVIIIAIVLSVLNRTMSWYAKPVWICFLYVLPTMSIYMAVIYRCGQKQQKRINSYWVLYQLHYDATQFLWTLLLFMSMLLKIRSGFIPLLWASFSMFGNYLQQGIYKYNRGYKWLILHALTIGLPFVQTFYLDLGALNMFIPIMGRTGSAFNSEIIVSFLICVMFGLLFSFSNQLILLARKPDLIISLPIGLSFISLALILLTPLGFPYSGTENALAPQRYIINHVDKIIYDESFKVIEKRTGYWIIDMDINSPHSIENIVPGLSNAELVDCTKELYCGMPYILPVLNFVWKTHWAPAPPPHVATESNIVLNNKEMIKNDVIRLNFTVTGPDHMSLLFSPLESYKLLRWSIDAEEPLKANKFLNRDTYFIYYSYSSFPKNWNFHLDFKVPTSHKLSDIIMDLSLHGHFLHGENKADATLEKMVTKFPNWTAVSYWTSTIRSMKF